MEQQIELEIAADEAEAEKIEEEFLKRQRVALMKISLHLDEDAMDSDLVRALPFQIRFIRVNPRLSLLAASEKDEHS